MSTPVDLAMLNGHEATLVSRFLNDETAIDRYPQLKPEHFASPAHRKILTAILTLHHDGHETIFPAVEDYLRSRGELAAIGEHTVSTLAADYRIAVMDDACFDYALEYVMDDWREREAARIGKELADRKITADFARAKLDEIQKPAGADSRRAPLTIRTIDEICSMKFDHADLILANGYAVSGDLTAVCGMGGVGKTRLVTQFTLCCRAGRDFLGWSTNGRDLRFLFLQTENSCRRLQSDFEKMLSAFTPDERKHLNAGIFFHTLEQDDDGFLTLDIENKERIENAITEKAADVVIYDPLRDFSLDDLNSDKFMGDTVRDILRVTKRGNPKRLPLVLHHAATGKAGAQKTTGWDRSSFGRNSKVLQIKARAVINVAPAQPDDNSVIIVASGKCNNMPEFEAFAARLSFETMLYARDDDFDMEGWRQEVGTQTSKSSVKPQIVRELLERGRDYDRQKIVALIREETGVQNTRAYELVRQAKARGILRFNKTVKTYALT
jgi:hypothetical protein